MAPLLSPLLFGLILASASPLEEEFGIYMDNMPTTQSPAERSGAMQGPMRSIYKSHAPEGSLAPFTQRNNTGAVQSNSRFNTPNAPRGSTLGSRNFSSSPTAPSRFNRPAFGK